jgi:hypothetical protein
VRAANGEFSVSLRGSEGEGVRRFWMGDGWVMDGYCLNETLVHCQGCIIVFDQPSELFQRQRKSP